MMSVSARVMVVPAVCLRKAELGASADVDAGGVGDGGEGVVGAPGGRPVTTSTAVWRCPKAYDRRRVHD